MTRSTAGLHRATLTTAATLLVAGILSIAPTHAQNPRIVLPEPVNDIGTVYRGDTATATFQVENQGDAPLVVREVETNCGCALSEAPEPVPPGGTGVIEVEIDTELLSGPSSVAVTLTTNDPESRQVQLTVKLESRNVLAVEPGSYRYLVHRDFTGDGLITQTIFATDGQDFEVTAVESPFPELRIEDPRPATEEERFAQVGSSQWSIDGYLDNKRQVGPLTGFVRVHTDHPKQKVVPIPVSGFVRPIVALTPETFELGSFVVPENGGYYDVHFKQFTADPMTLEEITVDLEGFSVEHRVVEEGRTWYIRLFAQPDAPVGPVDGKVTVKTSSELQPTVEIPVTGTIESGG